MNKKTKKNLKTRSKKSGAKNNTGKILKTNDIIFSHDGYSKPGRRVVIMNEASTGNLKVSKIKKIKPHKYKQLEHITPIRTRQKSLNVPSGVDKDLHYKNTRTNKNLSLKDPDLIDTHDRLPKKEFDRINVSNRQKRVIYKRKTAPKK